MSASQSSEPRSGKTGATPNRKSVGVPHPVCGSTPSRRYQTSPSRRTSPSRQISPRCQTSPSRRSQNSTEPRCITPLRQSNTYHGRVGKIDTGCSRGRVSPSRGRLSPCAEAYHNAVKRTSPQRKRHTLHTLPSPAPNEIAEGKEVAEGKETVATHSILTVAGAEASCAAERDDDAESKNRGSEFSGIAPAAEEWLAFEVLLRALYDANLKEDLEASPILIRDLLVRLGALKASAEWLESSLAKPHKEATKRRDAEEQLRDAIRAVVAKEKERDAKVQERRFVREELQQRLEEHSQTVERNSTALKEARGKLEDSVGENLMLRYTIQQDQETHVQTDEKWTHDLKIAAAELGKAKGALMLRNADLEVERKASQQVAVVFQEQEMELSRRAAVLSQAQDKLRNVLADVKALKIVAQEGVERRFVENDVKRYLLERLVAAHTENDKCHDSLMALQTHHANFAESEAIMRKNLAELQETLVRKSPAQSSTADDDFDTNEDIQSIYEGRHPEWALDQSRRSLHRGDSSSESDQEEVHLVSARSESWNRPSGEDGGHVISPFSVAPSEQSTCPSSTACRQGGPTVLLVPQLSLVPASEQPKLPEIESDLASEERLEEQLGAEALGCAMSQLTQSSNLTVGPQQSSVPRTLGVPRTVSQPSTAAQVQISSSSHGQPQAALGQAQMQAQAQVQTQVQAQGPTVGRVSIADGWHWAGRQEESPRLVVRSPRPGGRSPRIEGRPLAQAVTQVQPSAHTQAPTQMQAQGHVLVQVPTQAQLQAQMTSQTQHLFNAAVQPCTQVRAHSKGPPRSKAQDAHSKPSRTPPPPFAPPAFIGMQQMPQPPALQGDQSSGSWYAGMRQAAAGLQEAGHTNSWYLGASAATENLKTCAGADQYEQARAALAAAQCQEAGPKDSRKEAMEAVYDPVPGSQSGATASSLNDYVSYGKSLLGDLARKLR